MLIDYIYLIIIIILICAVLFFIYLSYEYRVFTERMSNNTNEDGSIGGILEPFIVLQPITSFSNANPEIVTNLSDFSGKYNDLSINTYNKQVLNNNEIYDNLLKQVKTNQEDVNTLLKISQKQLPTPKTFPINELVKTIKSNYNSQYLSLLSNDVNKYGVLVNDKCLTVKGLCKDEFCLQDCQKNLYTTDSQKFYTNRIYSPDDIVRITGIPKDKVNNKNVYPFNIFRSKVNDKCLNINDNGVSVVNCDLNSLSQQWAISPNENICVLE